MGIMNFLRNKMGTILVAVIGLALFAFIAGEVIQYGGSFLSGDNTTIGVVAGEKIPYEKFNENVERTTAQMQQQYGGGSVPPQMAAYAQEQTWNQMISRTILEKELKNLNLVVGTDETKVLLGDRNPHPQIAQAFGDPQTGKVDPAKLNQFKANLQNAKADDPIRERWRAFTEGIIESKKAEKYVVLVTNGLYVNSLEAKDDYEAKNKLANFKYVALEYAAVPDNKVTLTDGDYQEYYDAHKSLFKNKQELRSFEYVAFSGAPSKADSVAAKAEVDKLAQEFKASNNDSLFVQLNSETKVPFSYQKKGQLEPVLDSVMFNASKGFVYGPYLSGNTYKIAKLVDSRLSPDSVTASHILITPAEAGGDDKAQAKADSIKKLLDSGRSFADLATTFSSDKGSAEKGGSLGTFGRGAMVPEFEAAAFNGSKGDIKIVKSQFGFHIIRIENQKGSSQVVKLAIVDKPLTASSSTQSAAYSKAQAFLGNVANGDFDAQAKKAGVPVLPATDVNGVASNIPGLENARPVIKWAFGADKGDVSNEVFSVGDQFVVARLTTIKPEGILPLELVKPQIEAAVRNKVKAKQLIEKLAGARNGASNLAQVAQKAGGKVVPVQNIVFANPVLPGLGPEYSLIGSVFGSQPGKLSNPVEGQMGVYVFTVDGFVKPAPLTNMVKTKEQISQELVQRAQGGVFEALKDKANVKDYRAKFL
ncbi:peptidylprolyl isomerase [Mucilaginibacter hurinus]|uniref:Periplasmic chaperone PpiD n=1 Tax=Mucilaginibacter hurinus TaxID=2201324 RepID=A0A367GMF7_9SPHI|nr:SurA N-terminal domain-containing protein [Mucilaginibacter hurinus]RCH54639.1 peptidylprolyl isomerase [Mucilaginibacter hurinus]